MGVIVVVILILLAVGLAARSNRSRSAHLPADRLETGWSADMNWRVEMDRLLRHPAFIVGVLVTPLMLLAAVETETTGFRASTGLALGMVPLGWMTIIASNLIALRSRRSGTEELFVSLPTPYSVRTSGFLLLVPGAFVVAGLLLVAAGVTVSTFPDVVGLDSFEGPFAPLEMAAGALIVAGSVGVGVAVARWLPNVGWGIAAVFATVFLQARFLDTNTWPWNSTQSDLRRFLGFLAAPTSAPPELEVRRPGWHLVYLVGLVVLISVVAVARHGWSRRFVGGGLAVAFAAIAVAAVVQTRPPSSGQVDAMVALLDPPSSEAGCVARGAAAYCAFSSSTSTEDVDQWRARVDAVLAVLPVDPARRQLNVRQRPAAVVGNTNCQPMHFLEALPREIVSRVTPERMWLADGDVHPATSRDNFNCSEDDAGSLFVAVQTGAWAVDLPPAPHHDDVRCAADGQARSVLALWLGAQATPDGDALLRRTIDEGNDGSHLTFPGWDDRPVLGVTYAVGDALTALDILAKPRDQVIAAVRANWELLTAPSTGASTFAELVGVSAHAVGGQAPGREPCS
jgi:hypothetical protein